jgi:hypothetical protein
MKPYYVLITTVLFIMQHIKYIIGSIVLGWGITFEIIKSCSLNRTHGLVNF